MDNHKFDIKVLEKYKNAIDNFAKSGEDFYFKNSSPQHAAIIMSALFNHTKGTIKIFDYDLSGDIAKHDANSLSAIQTFIEKKYNLQVVICSNENQNSELFRLLKSSSTNFNHIIVKLASEKFKSEIKKSLNGLCHFAVGNSKSFRIETKEYNPKDENREAICNFHSPGIAIRLEKLFDQYFESCSPIFN